MFGTMAVLAGLGQAPIFRLKEETHLSKKHTQRYAAVRELLSREKNFQVYEHNYTLLLHVPSYCRLFREGEKVSKEHCFMITLMYINNSIVFLVLILYLCYFLFIHAGAHLTDLVFVEDGNKDELEGGLINFDKRYMVAKIIRELQSKCESACAYSYAYA